jgi:hypothetical protein
MQTKKNDAKKRVISHTKTCEFLEYKTNWFILALKFGGKKKIQKRWSGIVFLLKGKFTKLQIDDNKKKMVDVFNIDQLGWFDMCNTCPRV